MIATLRAVYNGRALRHRPVALDRSEQRPVRLLLRSGGRSIDITDLHVPASLAPLQLAVAHPASDAPLDLRGLVDVEFHDQLHGELVARMSLTTGGTLRGAGTTVTLVRPVASSMPCAPFVRRTWQHFLAWRHTRVGARRSSSNFQMTYHDLRSLNAYYVWPRPVFLVSVEHEDRSNLFPMDLVGPVSPSVFLMALRRTSPSVELMCSSRRVVVSSAPAQYKEIAYALGAHHRKVSIEWSDLPFKVRRSRHFGLLHPEAALRVRELEITDFHEVGSHMFFMTRVVRDDTLVDGPQLCHVSDMYAAWRDREGRGFVSL